MIIFKFGVIGAPDTNIDFYCRPRYPTGSTWNIFPNLYKMILFTNIYKNIPICTKSEYYLQIYKMIIFPFAPNLNVIYKYIQDNNIPICTKFEYSTNIYKIIIFPFAPNLNIIYKYIQDNNIPICTKFE